MIVGKKSESKLANTMGERSKHRKYHFLTAWKGCVTSRIEDRRQIFGKLWSWNKTWRPVFATLAESPDSLSTRFKHIKSIKSQ